MWQHVSRFAISPQIMGLFVVFSTLQFQTFSESQTSITNTNELPPGPATGIVVQPHPGGGVLAADRRSGDNPLLLVIFIHCLLLIH